MPIVKIMHGRPGRLTLWLMTGVAMMVYLVIARYLLPHYYYQINPDGICYITIARRYLGGDWM